MKKEEYAVEALRTEVSDFEGINERQTKKQTTRLLHAAMGLCTESGEFMDAIKRHIFYEDKLDLINLAEELGDQLWYINEALDALRELGINATWSRVMAVNIAKLEKRFPGKFDPDRAKKRDLEAERDALEGKS